jgi:ferrous iron transport protein A
MQTAAALTLDRLAPGRTARVASVDWEALPAADARRLRELGLYEGVEVEALHRGVLFFRDPLAIRLGRMRIMLRNANAMAVRLEPAAP